MANRVTAAEVKVILDNCTVEDTVIDVFVTSAELLITSTFSGDTTVGDTFLKEIERWFVAHMISSTLDRTSETEKIADVSIKYTGRFDTDLMSTPYGQMVVQLDTTGKMKSIGKRRVDIYAVKSFK